MSPSNRYRAEGRCQDRARGAWAAEPTAQVIHDSFYSDGAPVSMAPRYVLQKYWVV
jgi:glutamine synthetase